MAEPDAISTQNLRAPERGLVLVLAVLTAVTLAPLAVPVILAIWVSALASPLFSKIARGLNGRHRAAAVLVTTLVLLFVGVASLVVASALSAASELWDLITTSPGPRSALRALVSPTSAQPEGLPSAEAVTAWLMEHGVQAFGLLGGLAGAAMKLLIGLALFVFGTWTFLLDGKAAWAWAQARLPFAKEHLERLASAFLETGRGLIIGVGLTSATQAAAATVIYLALGVPRAIALGVVTGLASIVPVVGSALIWLPLALGLVLTGHPVRGAILLALGAGLISTLDNVLRPFFARFGRLDLPLFLLTLSMLGGIAAWGPTGALLGPIFTRSLIEVIAISRENRPP